MWDDGEAGAQGLELEGGDVDAVDKYLALRGADELEQREGEGGFTGAFKFRVISYARRG